MDEEAMMAVGMVLAVISGILERSGICTTMELAEKFGDLAYMMQADGPEFEKRAAYVGTFAHMLRAAARGGPSVHN